jgi:hypothetical protein
LKYTGIFNLTKAHTHTTRYLIRKMSHTVYRTVVGQDVVYFGDLSAYKEGEVIPMIILRKNGMDTLDFKWTTTFIANASVAIGQIPNYMLIIFFARCIMQHQDKFSDANVMYLTDNYRKAIATAKLQVATMVLQHITTQGLKRTEMIDFLYYLNKMGFRTPELTRLYNQLRFIEVEARFENIKARIIQRRFRDAIANPNTELCVRRLMHEYEEFDKCFE